MGIRSHRRSVAALAGTMLLAATSALASSPAGAAPPHKIGVAYDGGAVEGNPFNEMTQLAVERVAGDAKLKTFEAFALDRKGDEADLAAVLTKLARRSELVLAVGFWYGDAAGTTAASFPDRNFAIVDGASGIGPQPNLKEIFFGHAEGSFLVGAAAALTSTSGAIGFIGGMDIPVIEEFRAGFVAGVEYVDPAMTVETAYVGDFQNPTAAEAIALDMYERGIDVIYPAAGGSTIGAVWAASNYSTVPGHGRVWAMGVDYDLYPVVDPSLQPYVLTSMVKNVDVAVEEVLREQLDGSFTGGVDVFGLARDGVDYATSGGFVNDIVPDLEAIRAAIIDGSISVP